MGSTRGADERRARRGARRGRRPLRRSRRVEADELGRYAPELEAAVYFCCLEALQNAAKYAGDGADGCGRSCNEATASSRFEVADDGAGFDPASVNGIAGPQNMRDRIGALGGEVRIESAPGSGTRVCRLGAGGGLTWTPG